MLKNFKYKKNRNNDNNIRFKAEEMMWRIDDFLLFFHFYV